MELFRLARKKHTKELSGIGAAHRGGRWNNRGIRLIYASPTRCLSMSEIAVHFTWATLPDDYCIMTLYVPDDLSMTVLQIKDLPIGWTKYPYIKTVQDFGDKLIKETGSCLIKIPSAVVKGDHSILINPFHTDLTKVKILNVDEFPFDERLFVEKP